MINIQTDTTQNLLIGIGIVYGTMCVVTAMHAIKNNRMYDVSRFQMFLLSLFWPMYWVIDSMLKNKFKKYDDDIRTMNNISISLLNTLNELQTEYEKDKKELESTRDYLRVVKR